MNKIYLNFILLIFISFNSNSQTSEVGEFIGIDIDTKINFVGFDIDNFYALKIEKVKKSKYALLEGFSRNTMKRVFSTSINPDDFGITNMLMENTCTFNNGISIFYSTYDKQSHTKKLFFGGYDKKGKLIDKGTEIMSLPDVKPEKTSMFAPENNGTFRIIKNSTDNSILIIGLKPNVKANKYENSINPEVSIRILNDSLQTLFFKENIRLDFNIGVLEGQYTDEKHNIFLIVNRIANLTATTLGRQLYYVENNSGNVSSCEILPSKKEDKLNYNFLNSNFFLRSPEGKLILLGTIGKKNKTENISYGIYYGEIDNSGKLINEKYSFWKSDESNKKQKTPEFNFLNVRDAIFKGDNIKIILATGYDFISQYFTTCVSGGIIEIITNRDFSIEKMTELKRYQSINKDLLIDYSNEVTINKDSVSLFIYNETLETISTGKLKNIENFYEEVKATLGTIDQNGIPKRKAIDIKLNGDNFIPIQCNNKLILNNGDIISVISSNGNLYFLKIKI